MEENRGIIGSKEGEKETKQNESRKRLERKR